MTSNNSTFSFDVWEKNALSELESLQKRVSVALLEYQGNADKVALGEAANRSMGELKDAVKRLIKATPDLQQKVMEIAYMLQMIAHFSGITFDE
ncbi:hypothetical protein V5081_21410 [Enterobacter cancerogenus]|uniref:hypothetical protein n=1 Tax=Enterobacter cancerogenus TaxID=69218 RepID=UPI001AF7F01E|nr:hypothetical protein [Enterobacter cancerogenus]MDT7012792.1 hypothetical protein [Enterobacter cancerogenus]WNN59233.1 hypothetical protein RIN64_22980 [Enterobacter cancerogenus]CAD5360748.1 conserved protein of unknown function [Enterobacter cancerogenus]